MNIRAALKPRLGSWLWLLRHEMRLQWRGVGGARLWLTLIFGGVLYAAQHLTAWGVLRGTQSLSAYPPIAIAIAGAAPWFMFTLILSQAISMSVTALFDRGDLDLLLSSPLAVRTVFAVRGLGIAVGCVTLYAFLFTPFAHMGALMGYANLLAIYPALISMSLLVTAIGLFVTLSLVRAFGARRARVIAQVLGALVGAVFFLGLQAQNLLSAATRNSIAAWFNNAGDAGELLAADSFFYLPFQAMIGNPLSLLVFVVAGAGTFLLVVNLAHQRFLSGTQESITGSAHTAASRVFPTAASQFKSGAQYFARSVLLKEWKLIWRNPQLISQTLLQLLYLLPLIFMVFRKSPDGALIISSSIFLATSLAGSLAWITVSAEDAPELIGSAPVNIMHIRWLKALAAIMPVWILVLPIFVYLLTQNSWWALVFLVCTAASTTSAGMTKILYPRSGDRTNMKQRAKGFGVVDVLEALAAAGWAGVAYCLIIAPSPYAWFGLLALALALSAPFTAWLMGTVRRNGDAII